MFLPRIYIANLFLLSLFQLEKLAMAHPEMGELIKKCLSVGIFSSAMKWGCTWHTVYMPWLYVRSIFCGNRTTHVYCRTLHQFIFNVIPYFGIFCLQIQISASFHNATLVRLFSHNVSSSQHSLWSISHCFPLFVLTSFISVEDETITFRFH